MALELGYWGIKGRAEPVRWAYLALGLQVKEVQVGSGEEWGAIRSTLPTAFPNLPYIRDGDFAITETNALPIYLASKAGKPEFIGKDHKDQAILRQIEGVLGDIFSTLFKTVGAENPEEALKSAVTGDGTVITKLRYLSKFLGDKHFFLGYLTWADLLFTYIGDFLDALAASLGHKSVIAHFANLQGLSNRVHDHDALKARVQASQEIPYLPPQGRKFKFFNYKETAAFNAN